MPAPTDDHVCRELDALLRNRELRLLERLGMVEKLDGVEQCIVGGLRATLAAQDWFGFEMYVLAAQLKPDPAMVPVLADALLRKDSRLFPEEVVTALDGIADARAVPALREMVHWRPAWDEYHALAVKAVNALAGVDDEQARAVLVDLADSDGPEVLTGLARGYRD